MQGESKKQHSKQMKQLRCWFHMLYLAEKHTEWPAWWTHETISLAHSTYVNACCASSKNIDVAHSIGSSKRCLTFLTSRMAKNITYQVLSISQQKTNNNIWLSFSKIQYDPSCNTWHCAWNMLGHQEHPFVLPKAAFHTSLSTSVVDLCLPDQCYLGQVSIFQYSF